MLALLTSFDHSRVELGVTEMAASLGVHKSTASRLDGTGACVAALSVSGPAFRMRPESLHELGRLCADA